MSRPRYDWWPYVKGMIRRYPALRAQYTDLHSPGVTAGYSGLPRTGGPSGTRMPPWTDCPWETSRRTEEDLMRRWRDIEEDLALTARRPAGDPAMHRAFVEKNGITEWAFVPHRADSLPYILRTARFPAGCRRYPLEGFDLGPPPGLDHGRLYRNADRGEAHLVYHPYSLAEDEQSRLTAWCAAADAVALVLPRARSWYALGRTLLVVVTAKGVRF